MQVELDDLLSHGKAILHCHSQNHLRQCRHPRQGISCTMCCSAVLSNSQRHLCLSVNNKSRHVQHASSRPLLFLLPASNTGQEVRRTRKKLDGNCACWPPPPEMRFSVPRGTVDLQQSPGCMDIAACSKLQVPNLTALKFRQATQVCTSPLPFMVTTPLFGRVLCPLP